jgi:hypothetical protein
MSADGPLFDKFHVDRADGTSSPGAKHDGCQYFVLDLTHDQYAPAALRAYAWACTATHPLLSADLLDLLRNMTEGNTSNGID